MAKITITHAWIQVLSHTLSLEGTSTPFLGAILAKVALNSMLVYSVRTEQRQQSLTSVDLS